MDTETAEEAGEQDVGQAAFGRKSRSSGTSLLDNDLLDSLRRRGSLLELGLRSGGSTAIRTIVGIRRKRIVAILTVHFLISFEHK
jgi:hypothetical protein